jgi:vacuolar-type H+-ATPase subunit I/STV1
MAQEGCGGSGRGGRGPGRSLSRSYSDKSLNSRTSSQKPTSKTKCEFAPHGQHKGQQHTYEAVREAAILHIQKTFESAIDVVTSLKKMVKVDLTKEEPELEVSVKVDTIEQEREQLKFNAKYESKYNRHLDRVQHLNKGMQRAVHTVLFLGIFAVKQCNVGWNSTPSLKQKLKMIPLPC